MKIQRLFFTFLLAFGIVSVVFQLFLWTSRPTEAAERFVYRGRTGKCPDLLSGMTRGWWQTRELTDFEKMSMSAYLQSERSSFRIPPTFQRADGRCGANITYEGVPQYSHMWFKALCDFRGSTPCCKDGRCVDLPVEQCRCPECYDERQVIYAEFSKWRVEDGRCQPEEYTQEKACRLLNDSTLFFVGDSYVREAYIALSIRLSGNLVDGALRSDLNRETYTRCLGWFQVTGASCRHAVDEDRRACGGNVHIKYFEIWNAYDVNTLLSINRRLKNTPKALVVFGLGIHDNFDFSLLNSTFFQPLLNNNFEFLKNQVLQENLSILNFDKLNNFLQLLTNSTIANKVVPNGYNSSKKLNVTETVTLFSERSNKTISSDQITVRDDTNANSSLTNNNVQAETDKNSSKHKTDKSSVHRWKDTNTTHNIAGTNPAPTSWPRLLWLGIHAPGLLKSPHFHAQTIEGVMSYNKAVASVLDPGGIPRLETFSFTEGVSSFDGTHYGWAVNLLKADMIVTYIHQELIERGSWR